MSTNERGPVVVPGEIYDNTGTFTRTVEGSVVITKLSYGKAVEYVKGTFKQEEDGTGRYVSDIKGGRAMRLPQWSPDVLIRLHVPDDGGLMTAPFLYADSRHGRVPWIGTQIEIFSHDWEVVTLETYLKTIPDELKYKK